LLFIFNNFYYSQSIYNSSSFLIKEMKTKKLGLFTNFSIIGYPNVKKINFKNTAGLVISFFLSSKNCLLTESKKKDLPTIGLVTPEISLDFIDYPIYLNFSCFYSTYFFNKFLLKFLLK
jgi:hypothetical protein